MHRLPTAELLTKLRAMQKDLDGKVAAAVARVEEEEAKDPEHGQDAHARVGDEVKVRQQELRELEKRLRRHEQQAAQSEADRLGNGALLLHVVHKRYDESEKMYRKALKADKEHPTNLGNFALFLQHVRHDRDLSLIHI